MANTLHKNTIFVDATGDITVDAMRPILKGLLVTPSAANSVVVIKESSSTGTTKVHLIRAGTDTYHIDFGLLSGGLLLTKTFNITTLTNITNVILIGEWKAPVGRAQ